jgi:hypothetical protein
MLNSQISDLRERSMYAVVFHAHQKIDRIAYKHVRRLVGKPNTWPQLRTILHFEGKRGPDASKLKNNPESGEQPWHFVDPFDAADQVLAGTLEYHYHELVKALKAKNTERAAFEAAWLAHALVDGLTPAHHYPYEEKLEDLRGGKKRDNRTSVFRRITVKGETHRESLKRSFRLVGPKGLLMTHTAFEGGAYAIIQPLALDNAYPSAEELKTVRDIGVVPYFERQAREIGALNLYERFYKLGWTPKLAREVRREMAPRMVSMVALAWYSALVDAGLVKDSIA